MSGSSTRWCDANLANEAAHAFWNDAKDDLKIGQKYATELRIYEVRGRSAEQCTRTWAAQRVARSNLSDANYRLVEAIIPMSEARPVRASGTACARA